ncbi:MAG: deoxyribonuclease V [Thermoanaerobaculia bacterium]
MRIRRLHPWNLTPGEAIEVQKSLRGRVETADRLGRLRWVAGVDVGFDRDSKTCRAALAVLSWPDLELEDRATAEQPATFPYVPGLLSFREIPVVLEGVGRLTLEPDLLICDGQGYAHPRRFGLASHLGLVTDTPSIGVAKSRLIGTHEEPPPERGGRTPLVDGEEIVGMVLRTRTNVRPVYVSIGHRVRLETAVELALRAAPRYRLPEPTRWAHRLARLSHRSS